MFIMEFFSSLLLSPLSLFMDSALLRAHIITKPTPLTIGKRFSGQMTAHRDNRITLKLHQHTPMLALYQITEVE